MKKPNCLVCCATPYSHLHLRFLAVLYFFLIFIIHNTNASEQVEIRDVLAKAKYYILEGNAIEAYTLLSPLEPELAGSVDFDYLFGVAALDSGHPVKATLAFERVLLIKPNFAGARLDLGRAYFAMGNFIMAQNELHKVLALNPPPLAKKATNAYLDAIKKKLSRKRTVFSFYGEVAGGYDDNINTSTDENLIYVPIYFSEFLLSEENIQKGDNYRNIGAGFNVDHRLYKNLSCSFSGNGTNRSYVSENEFNTSNFDMTGSLSYDTHANLFKLGVTYGRFFLDNKTNRESVKGDLEWRYMVNSNNLLVTFGQYMIARYPEMEIDNFNQGLVGLSWLHALKWIDRTFIVTSTYAGMEKDTEDRADGEKKFGGILAGFEISPIDSLSFFAGAGGQYGSYDKENLAFLEKREDQLVDARAGMKWMLAKNITVKPQINFILNNSNIQIYEYSRTDVSVTFRYDYQ